MEPATGESEERTIRSRTLSRYSRYALCLAIALIGSAGPIQARSIEAIFDSMAEVEKVARELCNTVEADNRIVTFRELAELWTSGELARRHPDHVRSKRTADFNRQRPVKLYPTLRVEPKHARDEVQMSPTEPARFPQPESLSRGGAHVPHTRAPPA